MFTHNFTALYGVEAATESTITCSACPSPSSTNDIVTRSAVTTPSCSGASFTIIHNEPRTSSGTVGPTGTSTVIPTSVVPVAAGNRNVPAGMAGALVVAAVAPYLM